MTITISKKALILVAALVLIIGCGVGGTVAWLTDSTDEVVNTFTLGDVSITLAETTGTEYKMVPGEKITKDPIITVTQGSEKCYVFVEITAGNNFSDYMTYSPATGWIQLNASNVYYQVVDASSAEVSLPVILNNEISVKTIVTREMYEALGTNIPKLTFKAYAVQYSGFENNPAGAFDAVKIAG